MPVLNLQFRDQDNNASPPTLTELGPRIPGLVVKLGQGLDDAQVFGDILIDTGATSTCVDIAAAAQAGLTQVDTGSVMGATGGVREMPVFAATIGFQDNRHAIQANRAVGTDISAFNIIALLGRDVLQQSVLTYNGPAALATLAF